MVSFKIWLLMITFRKGLSEANNLGREFVIPFLSNFEKKRTIYLYLTARSDASVYVEIPWENRQETIGVSAGTSEAVSLNWQSRYEEDLVPVKKAVYINSSAPLVVCSFSYVSNSGSSFLALPVDVLGDLYVAVSYTRVNFDTSVIAAAVEDGTEVTFHYNVNGGSCGPGGFTSGATSTHVINRLEVIGVKCSGDLTGTFVTSNKPISVVSGNIGGSIPTDKIGKDVFEDMMIPVKDLGTEFVLANAGRAVGTIHRIVAVSDNTEVTSSNGDTHNLMTSEFFDTDTGTDGEQFIQSNKPIQVVAFGKGIRANSDRIGDPLMVVVPPVSSFSYDYFIDLDIAATTSKYNCKDVITVIGATVDMPQLEALLGETHSPIAGSDYGVIYKEITGWPFQLTTDNTTRSAVLLYQVSSSYFGAGLPFGMILSRQYCWASTCQNSGTCEEVDETFLCHCPVGYEGDRCQNMSGATAGPSTLDYSPTTVMTDTLYNSNGMTSTWGTLQTAGMSSDLSGTSPLGPAQTDLPFVTDLSYTDISLSQLDNSAGAIIVTTVSDFIETEFLSNEVNFLSQIEASTISWEILPTTLTVNVDTAYEASVDGTTTILDTGDLQSSGQIPIILLPMPSTVKDPARDYSSTLDVVNTLSQLKQSRTALSYDLGQSSLGLLQTSFDPSVESVTLPVYSMDFTIPSKIAFESTNILNGMTSISMILPNISFTLPHISKVSQLPIDPNVEIPQMSLSLSNVSLDLSHVSQVPVSLLPANVILKRLHEKALSIQISNVRLVCTCLCRGSRLDNMDEVSIVTERIQSDLLLDTKTLSKTIRKYISAPDKRDSVKQVGAVGIVMMALTFGVMVISDVMSLVHELWRYCKKRNYR